MKRLDDTGERMVPEYHKGSMMYGEHMVRYQAASFLVKGKTVLDIACGTGYGSSILAMQASKVTGVDLNEDTIEYAKKKYSSEKIEFKVGSATAIPLGESSVDVVVSFETIEHISDYKKFLKEVKRVLKTDGLFVVSTPNDKEFPEGADFHVHEFKQAELEGLLSKHFKNIKTFYQSTWLYNALLDQKAIATEKTAKVITLNASPVGPQQAIYFFILCSDSKINNLPPAVGAMSERWTTKAMLEHNAKMEKYIKDTMAHYEDILKKKDQEIQGLYKIEAEHHQLKVEISSLGQTQPNEWPAKIKAMINRITPNKDKS